jgi:hypothetical protein
MKPHAYYTRVKDQQYRAAGVLPFAIAPAGQVLVLLGRERGWGPRSKVLRWKDFGGHREAIDEDAEATAAREFSEETLGLFGGVEVASCSIAASTSTMTDRLRSSGGVFRVESPLRNGGNYCMFVAPVAYIDPLLFNLATQENAVTKGVDGAEKCGFAWVRNAAYTGFALPSCSQLIIFGIQRIALSLQIGGTLYPTVVKRLC